LVLTVPVAMPRAYPRTLGPRPTGYPPEDPERPEEPTMSSSPTDAVDLILQDHRELERMFDELRRHPEKRPATVPVMATLLFAHSRAEEAEVYPAARGTGGEEDVQHSQKEHLVADQLAEKLGETDPGSPGFDDVLEELIHAVEHHLEEEETTVLPHLRERMGAEELDRLGRAFLEARERHLGGRQEDITRDELAQQAENIDMAGSSGMTKDELGDRLDEEAEL
jgi:hemerythrin superfamily protein